MDAFDFVLNFQKYVEEISLVIKDEYKPIIDSFKTIDPHDLVQPTTWFPYESAAKGYIWGLLVKEIKKTI